jgi:hypothetical protein
VTYLRSSDQNKLGFLQLDKQKKSLCFALYLSLLSEMKRKPVFSKNQISDEKTTLASAYETKDNAVKKNLFGKER